MSAGVLATTAHAEGRHPQELSGLQDRDGGGLQDGRVGAKPRDDQPHPVALARVKAREVAASRTISADPSVPCQPASRGMAARTWPTRPAGTPGRLLDSAARGFRHRPRLLQRFLDSWSGHDEPGSTQCTAVRGSVPRTGPHLGLRRPGGSGRRTILWPRRARRVPGAIRAVRTGAVGEVAGTCRRRFGLRRAVDGR